MMPNKHIEPRVFFLICGGYAVLSYLHFVLKLFLVDPTTHFGDFAHFYFIADLIRHGINVLGMSAQAIDILAKTSGIPDYICGGYGGGLILYSPSYYAAIMPLTCLDYNVAKLIWYVLLHSILGVSIYMMLKITCLKVNISNLALLSFIVFTFQPIIEIAAIGHMADALLLIMLLALMLSLVSCRPVLAGVFMAAVVLVGRSRYAAEKARVSHLVHQ